MNPLNIRVVGTVFFLVVFDFCENQALNSSVISSNKNSTNRAPLSDEIGLGTGFCVHNLTYTATLTDFSLREKKKDNFESPLISAATNDDCIWRLFLQTTSNDYYNRIYVSFFLRIESKIEKVVGKYTVSILNNKGKPVWSSKESTYTFIRGGGGPSKFIEKDEYFRKQLLQNDTLIISYKLSYYIPCTSTNLPNTTTTPVFNTIGSDLVENLESLFENPAFADVLISVNGKNFWAHKNILATRSVIFADLIRNTKTTDELGRTLLSITDMDEEVTGEILRYIYTGRCKNLDKLAKGLLVAAKQYALAPLKKICAETVSKSLSVENAADLLVFADTHGPDELKAQVIEFIVKNSDHVLNSTAWKNMVSSNSKLVNEVCQALAHFANRDSKEENNITQMCRVYF